MNSDREIIMNHRAEPNELNYHHLIVTGSEAGCRTAIKTTASLV